MIQEPALPRPMAGVDRSLSLASDQTLLQLEQDPVYRETLMRFVSLRLIDWGMRKKDVAYLCGVSSYFLNNTAAAIEHTGGAGPGAWTICRHQVARREAAMFLVEWRVENEPFRQKPSAVRLATAYRRYVSWHFRDRRRQYIDPSTALAIIRNIASGQLRLHRCLQCTSLSLQVGKEKGEARGGTSCSFCGCPHSTQVPLTRDQRIPAAT